MNPIRQLFGQTAVYGFGTVVPRLLNYLLLTPFFTRVFELGQYGIVTELYAYVVFLIIILTYGMETAFFRFARSHPSPGDVFNTSLISLMVTSTVFILAIRVFRDQIASILGYGGHPEYIFWVAIIVGIDAFTSIPFAKLRWENKAAAFAGIRIASVLMNIGLNFAFLYFIPEMAKKQALPGWLNAVYDPQIGVGYVFISNLAASIFSLLLLSGTIVKMRIRFDRGLWTRMIAYSLPLLIAGLAGTVNEALDRVLLKHLLPDPGTALEQLGIYGANYKIAVLMTLFVQMFRYASEPFYFSKHGQKDAKELFAQVMKYFIIAALGIFLTVTLFIDIFKHFIGRAFHEGLHIVPVVLLANLFLGIFFNLSIWYKLNDLTKFGAIITTMGAVITFLVNWFFIPIYGYTASAWAHLACYSSMVLVSWMLGRKYYKIPYPLKRIGLYGLTALIIFTGAKLSGNMETILRFAVNAGLIMGFGILVMILERKRNESNENTHR